MSRNPLEKALRDVESRLRGRPASLDLKFERARLLDRLGRTEEARAAYVDVLRRDATHFGALNDFGMLLFRAGRREEALTCFRSAVEQHPRNAIGHANLGLLLLRGGDAEAALEQYEIAAGLDPRNAETRRGLALALEAAGQRDRAADHRDAAFRTQPVMTLPYRGTGAGVRVLSIVSAGPGNTPTDAMLDDRVFAVSKAIAEYCDEGTPLPAHDLIFNAVGDPDAGAAALHAAASICARSGAPVVNAPAAVLAGDRVANAVRFAEIDGCVVPRAVRLARTVLGSGDAAREIAARRLAFPLVLRAPGYHAGQHMERAGSLEEAVTIAASMPGEELLAIEYVDVRGRDGMYRKYRAMFVGGRLYPLHLAVSAEWKVHYFSANMGEAAEHRAEERAFLEEPDAVIGPVARRALESICAMLALDYAGVDFSLDAQGRAVVFEANATMIVTDPPDEERWAYKRAPVERIRAATREMLLERARIGRAPSGVQAITAP